jgi:hypothetical protein
MQQSLLARSIIALILMVSASHIIQEAQGQDFNHRDSRERRRGDWRRGFSDGTECNRSVHFLVDAVCQVTQYGPDRHLCDQARREATGRPEVFLSALAGPPYMSHRVYTSRMPTADRRLAELGEQAMQALECEGDRAEEFDRDTRRESEEWHRSQGEEPGDMSASDLDREERYPRPASRQRRRPQPN